MTIEKEIIINAPKEMVWKVLINPEYTVQYMYGCKPETDWQQRSDLLWRGAEDGKVYVKGTVIESVPDNFLLYSVFDPNDPTLEDIVENYTTVAYELVEEDGKTILKLKQGDFSHVSNGEQRYTDSEAGWDSILPKIKELAENA